MRILQPSDLDHAIRAVEAGALVILPTRRWYMICANAQDREACERIFSAKRRPLSKSMAYILPDIATADKLFMMTPAALRLSKTFWPGDLALILKWRNMTFAAQHELVGVPNALVSLDPGLLGTLARRSRVPIAATTVNVSTGADTAVPGPAIIVSEVQQFIANTEIDVYCCIDGGICPLANHLTIVDCSISEPTLVRAGVIHERAIAASLIGLLQ